MYSIDIHSIGLLLLGLVIGLLVPGSSMKLVTQALTPRRRRARRRGRRKYSWMV